MTATTSSTALAAIRPTPSTCASSPAGAVSTRCPCSRSAAPTSRPSLASWKPAAAPAPPSPGGCAPSPGSTSTLSKKSSWSTRPPRTSASRLDYESHTTGGKAVTIPLAPRTARAIDLAIGERTEGPLFVTADGRRLDRHGAARVVRRVTSRAGISKHVSPHTLRHAFITAALDAGVPLRDVQETASHADLRTTMRYDRARTSLDRHASYIVAAFIAGAVR
jgi:Phage integrase family